MPVKGELVDPRVSGSKKHSYTVGSNGQEGKMEPQSVKIRRLQASDFFLKTLFLFSRLLYVYKIKYYHIYFPLTLSNPP